MSPNDEQRFHALLTEALDRPPHERQAFLAEACGADRGLFDELSALVECDADGVATFLDRPAGAATREGSGATSATASTVTSLASASDAPTIRMRLRKTPRAGGFLVLVALNLALLAAATLGAHALLRAPAIGFSFSQLQGGVRDIGSQWVGLERDDRILTINGAATDGEPQKIRRVLLDLQPGPLSIRFARADETFVVDTRARRRTLTARVLSWTRVVTGAALMAIGIVAFLLRPGERVTWLFFLFCSAVAVHLLGHMALIRFPREGIVLESLGMLLSAALALHFFSVFPQPLSGHRGWALWAYLPAVVGALTLLVFYRDDTRYGLVASVIQHAHTLAAVAAVWIVAIAVIQLRRAGGREIERARARASLVAVLVGLFVPVVMGVFSAFDVVGFELDWALNSFLVLVFVSLTAYSLVRHNALEVDRFTASIVGYGTTLVALTLAFGTALVALQVVLGKIGLFASPVAAAAVTAVAYVLSHRIFRQLRGRIDHWFHRDGVDESTHLEMLRDLTDASKDGDFPAAVKQGLQMAAGLGTDRAELWTRSPDGKAFLRLALGDPRHGVGSPVAIAATSALARELASGSGGVASLTDHPLSPEAQEVLWRRDLALAAPVVDADGVLRDILAIGRKHNGAAFNRNDRALLDTIATQLAITVERNRGHVDQLGPYRILDRLGTGGMAEVFLAEKLGPGGFERHVALKRMLPHLAQQPTSIAMFLDEARIAAGLRHPNIISILDIETLDGTYYLSMEYLDGPSLAEVMAAPEARRGLSLPLAAAVADAILSALAYTHARQDSHGRPMGLVHRDIKPANVLFSKQGEIKLTDFGIARAEIRLHQTEPGDARGTPAFMAPEQLAGDAVGPWSDLWATAAVLYRIVTGKRLRPGLIARAPEAPNGLAAKLAKTGLTPALTPFFQRALAVRPEDRFADAEATRKALRAAIAPAQPADLETVASFLGTLSLPGRARGPIPRLGAHPTENAARARPLEEDAESTSATTEAPRG